MECSQSGSSVHGIFHARTGVDCRFLLQGIFPTQGSNPGLPHCRQILYHLSHQGKPEVNYGQYKKKKKKKKKKTKKTSVLYTAPVNFTDWWWGWKGVIGSVVRCFCISAFSDLPIQRLLMVIYRPSLHETLQKTSGVQNGLSIPSVMTEVRQVVKRSRD